MHFWYFVFQIYITKSKYSSANYYQGNKQSLQKMHVNDIKIYLNKKKKKVAIW